MNSEARFLTRYMPVYASPLYSCCATVLVAQGVINTLVRHVQHGLAKSHDGGERAP